MLPCQPCGEVGESHAEQDPRREERTGVPQARLVRVFLLGRQGGILGGARLGDFLSDPLVNASNNAIDEKPRSWRGWDHGFKRPPGLLLSLPSPPPASECALLLPHSRTAEQMVFTGPATWVRGAFPSFPGSQGPSRSHAVPNWPASVDGSSQSCPQT